MPGSVSSIDKGRRDRRIGSRPESRTFARQQPPTVATHDRFTRREVADPTIASATIRSPPLARGRDGLGRPGPRVRSEGLVRQLAGATAAVVRGTLSCFKRPSRGVTSTEVGGELAQSGFRPSGSRHSRSCPPARGFQSDSIAATEPQVAGPRRRNLPISTVSPVGDPGLEPGTSSLSEKRSNRLS